MHKTPFAGLTELDDNDPLLIDGGSFTQINPSKTDHLLQVGAVSHRHDAHAALANPLRAPSATLDPTGGSIPAQTTVYVGYTVEDGLGGETRISPVVNATTDLPLNSPSGNLTASGDYSAGSLMIGNYYYGITHLDGAGGETPLGPAVAFARNPGAASAQVHLSGLATELNPPLGPVAWRLWRSQNGQQFQLLASGTGNTFLDNGVQCTDCTVQPPTAAPGGNTTKQTSLLHVTLPTPAQEPVVGSGTAAGGLMRLYLSTDGLFGSPSFYNAYPLSSAGADIQIPFLSVDTGAPPDVSTCIPGANQINPDTDIFDWHWKRPVQNIGNLPSGSQGDVRLVIGIGVEYGVLGASAFGPADWSVIGASGVTGPPGASATLTVGGPGVMNPTLAQRIALAFVGSGGTGVAVTDLGGGSAQILISGPQATGGGGGPGGVAPTIAGSAGSPKLFNKPYTEYGASGEAQIGIEDMGGGSARIVVYAPPAQPIAVGKPQLLSRAEIDFIGSGGTGVAVTDLGGGSAQVLISGPLGGGGGGGPGVAPTVAGSGGVPTLLNKPYVEYAGSGGIGVSVQDLGGGSARVVVGQASGLPGTINSYVDGVETITNTGALTAAAGVRDKVTFISPSGGVIGIHARLDIDNTNVDNETWAAIFLDGSQIPQAGNPGELMDALKLRGVANSLHGAWTRSGGGASGGTGWGISSTPFSVSPIPTGAGDAIYQWVPAGVHTVELRYRVTAGTGKVQCRLLAVETNPPGGGGGGFGPTIQSGSAGIANIGILPPEPVLALGSGLAATDDPGHGATQVKVNLGRKGMSFLTPSLASGWQASGVVGGSANIDVAVGTVKGMLIYEVATDRAARVRLYAGSGDRLADAGRSIGVDPAGDHGVMLELVTIPTDTDWRMSPMVGYANLDPPLMGSGSTVLPLRIDNLGAVGPVQVTVNHLPLEF